MKREHQILALFCALALGGCANAPSTTVYAKMDNFVEELATRAKAKMGQADDFQVVVTQAYYPIGTLMRTGSTIPIDYNACVPLAAEAPPKTATPNLFPVYTLSKSLAVELGLDNEAVKAMADVGVTVKDKDEVSLTVKSPQIQVIADNQLAPLLVRSNCRAAIPDTTAWLVRGYILGQRTFTLKNDKSANFKGKIIKVASFNLSGDGAESLNLTDDTQIGFLQIVSQVSTPQVSNAPVSVTKPTVATGVGKVYVQRDTADLSGDADLVVAALKAVSFRVENTVERIKSARMPKLAEVRYFNEDDRSNAERALLKVREKFPNAIVRRISLPAPIGQLEVWLPRTQTS